MAGVKTFRHGCLKRGKRSCAHGIWTKTRASISPAGRTQVGTQQTGTRQELDLTLRRLLEAAGRRRIWLLVGCLSPRPVFSPQVSAPCYQTPTDLIYILKQTRRREGSHGHACVRACVRKEGGRAGRTCQMRP